MCPTCWDVRARTVVPTRNTSEFALANAALTLGVIALIPGCWPVQLAGLITSGISLSKAYKKPGRARGQSIAGLVLSALGALLTVLVLGGLLLKDILK